MKTNRPLATVCILATLGLVVACGNKNKDDEEEATTIAATSTKTSSPPSSDTKPSNAATTGGGATPDTSQPATPKGNIDAHIKAEVDQKTDGGVTGGKAVSVTGAKANFSVPNAWTVNAAKGDLTTAQSADGKTWIAASPFDGDAKRDAAAAGLGLTNCQWNPPEAISVGKDKLAAMGADGLCTKGTAQVHTAYFGDTTENLLVMGAWDNAGGNMADVFSSMKSLAKPAAGDASGIGPCCDALRQNSKSAPLQQQGFYLAAAGVCDSIRNNPQGRQMLGQVRGALMGASMPSQCK